MSVAGAWNRVALLRCAGCHEHWPDWALRLVQDEDQALQAMLCLGCWYDFRQAVNSGAIDAYTLLESLLNAEVKDRPRASEASIRGL